MLRLRSAQAAAGMTFLSSKLHQLFFLRYNAHVDGSKDSGTKASEEDAKLCRVLVRTVFKSKASDKESHRKSDTGKHATTPKDFPGVARLLGNANLHREEAEEENTNRLTEDESERHGAKHRNIQTTELDFDTGIRERKERHDAKVHPRDKHLVHAAS